MPAILLADDDQLLRQIMRERLERDGHEVVECGDGFAAIEIATEERPDCLILDVMMPLARGLEVVRQVRRIDGWNPGIVMVSARTRVTDRLNALEAGADVYLEKPIAPEALVEAVARVTVDRTPTRIVDVLGPVWATLAMDRLLRQAAQGDRPARAAAVRELFADRMLRVLGRVATDAPQPPAALRILWERSLRTLVGDAADPIVPTATDIAVPDARALLGLSDIAPGRLPAPTPADVASWTAVLGRVLATRTDSSTPAAVEAVEARFAGALGRILGIDDRVEALVAAALTRSLGRDGVGALERLHDAFATRLGDVLGIHAAEGDMWARALARALAHRAPGEMDGSGLVRARIEPALDAALRGVPAPTTVGAALGDLWVAALDEVLRGRGGAIAVPDVGAALTALRPDGAAASDEPRVHA